MLRSSELVNLVLKQFKPPEKLTVSQWADKHRRLSRESSAMPGRWRTSVVEYFREPMDCVGDPRVEKVVVRACAQVGKSEFLNNTVGFVIDVDPSPILMLQPTIEAAEDYSKDRIAPMFRDTPSLRTKVADEKSKTSGNTIKNKKFPGGYLVMVGANAPSGLASRPIRAVFADEIDRAPVSAGEEGDPVNLAIKRTATFWNRIILLVSTPTVKHASRIDDAYEEGDQRVHEALCHECGDYHELKWSNVQWDDDPDNPYYVCDCCGCTWTDPQRIANVRKGRWRATKPFTGVASFTISGLMSPFATMRDGVKEFLAAKDDPAKLKVWVNTYLGQSWEEKGQQLEAHTLHQRCEEYAHEIPEGVSVLTMGADVQDDRIEAEIVGWGDHHESWGITRTTIYGDLSTNGPWDELDDFRSQIFEHPVFGHMRVRRVCVDSGGHFTTSVYDYVRGKQPDVFAIKGVGGVGKPIVGKPSTNNIGKIPLVPVGVDTAKEALFAHLQAEEGAGGYCHFPADYPLEYFKQLTAEKRVTRYHKGFKKQEFIKIRPRNEALDTRVYARAALELCDIKLESYRRLLQSKLDKLVEEKENAVETKKPVSRVLRNTRPQSGYATSWRD